MKLPSCPQMTRLGRLLVDAYRRFDDRRDIDHARHDIDRVRREIAAHRKSCNICIQALRQKTSTAPAQIA